MKCPKCKFISFDYNDTCPKCERSIAGEREKMHHGDFKPDTPFLLGSLLGGSPESHISLEVLESETAGDTGEMMLAPDLISTARPMDIELEESSPAEVSGEEALSPIEETDDVLELEDLAPEKEEPSEEDFVEVSTADEEPEELVVSESSPFDDEALAIELDDLLEAEAESEPRAAYTDEEALTLEVETPTLPSEDISDQPTPTETEPTPEPEAIPDIPDMASMETHEPAPDVSDMALEEALEPVPDIPDMGPLEPPEEAISELEADSELAFQLEKDELFSLDKLKGYKMGDYDIPSKSKSGTVPAKDSPPASDQKIHGTSGVWDEISKDLEELDFDIEETP